MSQPDSTELQSQGFHQAFLSQSDPKDPGNLISAHSSQKTNNKFLYLVIKAAQPY